MAYTIIVAASSYSPAPSTGYAAIGEYFRIQVVQH
jgi:hypothetical protein